MPTVPSGMLNFNGNMLCALDVETTGRISGWHEIIQIAVVPLDSNIEPVEHLNPFYMNIAPQHPERAEQSAATVHGLNLEELQNNCPDPWKVADLFDDWIKGLDLPFNRSLIPLAHNYPFERGFLMHWLGIESFDQFFYMHGRDTMQFAININDAAAFHGLSTPFPYVGLKSMCKKCGIHNEKAHDALCDSLATAQLYKKLLESFGR